MKFKQKLLFEDVTSIEFEMEETNRFLDDIEKNMEDFGVKTHKCAIQESNLDGFTAEKRKEIKIFLLKTRPDLYEMCENTHE